MPAELVEAARATGFDEVVAGLPQGWDTLVGSGGVGLSVGQRQRLALTRALCSTAPLVVMDEPTAHLDDKRADTAGTSGRGLNRRVCRA